ncbi:MAG: hypothetical protein ACRENJ_03845 [Candidatus Eiseniibacteriota bacterium]
MTLQRDLFVADATVPPPGRYRVRFTSHERLTSESRDTMWRLTASIVTGSYAGWSAYKMLTDDLKGLEWLEGAARRLGVKAGPTIPTALAALGGLEATVSTYHYRHATAGTFLTIRNVVARGR